MHKKLNWILMIIALVALLWCGAVFAEAAGTDGDIAWTLSNDGLLTISGSGAMKDYSMDFVNGEFITSAHWGTGMTHVVVEAGVTSIGNYAFYGCSNLTSITIPNSVTSIGNSAFCNCRCLANVAIPDGVTSIGDSAFSNCSSLTSVTIPNNVSSIRSHAFYNCSNLISIMIPDSVTNI